VTHAREKSEAEKKSKRRLYHKGAGPSLINRPLRRKWQQNSAIEPVRRLPRSLREK
jgi:hypothetical protein